MAVSPCRSANSDALPAAYISCVDSGTSLALIFCLALLSQKDQGLCFRMVGISIPVELSMWGGGSICIDNELFQQNSNVAEGVYHQSFGIISSCDRLQQGTR